MSRGLLVENELAVAGSSEAVGFAFVSDENLAVVLAQFAKLVSECIWMWDICGVWLLVVRW